MISGLVVTAALAPKMMDFYIGTYTTPGGSEGIYSSRLNTETGALSAPVLAAKLANPSALALDPSGKRLYAVMEFSGGDVAAFAVGTNQTLTPLKGSTFAGGGPCHLKVSPDGKTLLVAAYGGGSLASFAISPDGSLAAPATVITHQGKGAHPDRQKQSHMHFVSASPDGRHAYGVCLGTDSLLGFQFVDGSSHLTALQPAVVKTRPGAGPRHLAFDKSGRHAYVVNELDMTVGVFSRNTESGILTPVHVVPSLPGVPGESAAKASGAAILMHPSGRWLYTTSRTYNAIISYPVQSNGRLGQARVTPIAVAIPRGAAIDPSGRWLVVAGQDSGDLHTFAISRETGMPSATGHTIRVGRPTWIEFFP
jgi:6-phosphogluconolactonase